MKFTFFFLFLNEATIAGAPCVLLSRLGVLHLFAYICCVSITQQMCKIKILQQKSGNENTYISQNLSNIAKMFLRSHLVGFQLYPVYIEMCNIEVMQKCNGNTFWAFHRT